MIRTVFNTECGQPRHDDHPRDVLPRGVVKMQVFYDDVVTAQDHCVAAGITGSGIGELRQIARPVGSQSYRPVSCAGYTDPNAAGKGGPLLEVDDISRRQ